MLTSEKIQIAFDKLLKKDGEFRSAFIAYELGDTKNNKADNLLFELEESVGGSEGDGENCSKVFKVTDIKTKEFMYIKFDGYYSSYDGADFENPFNVVEPELVQVRQFKVVK